ncbi:MAG: hypothetical protein ACUVWR_19405 [Anaerolineae bacterium]
MKKKALISLLLVAILAALVALPATAADPITKTATVTVNEVINFSVTDESAEGINFGNPSAGSNNNPEQAQVASQGGAAVILIVHNDTNVNCSIQMKGGGDFTNGNGGSIPLSKVKWNTSNTWSGAPIMPTDYYTVGTSTAGAQRGVEVWYWLDVPTGQQAGVYTTTFYYRAVKQ